MTVYLVKPGPTKADPLNDDDKVKYSYEVTGGGVLRVLTADVKDLKWSVLREYSPQGWLEVSGTRYVNDTDKLSGFGGTAERKSSPMQVF